jgi:hypothetical protein
MSFSNFRSLKLVGIGTALLATLSLSPFFTGKASADFALCRTDPVVLLSNGVVVDLTASISDSAADVSQIVYTVHVPQGVSVARIYETGPLAGVETENVVADRASGTYDSTTTVTTASGATVPVTVTTLVAGPNLAAGLAFGSTTGTSSQTLAVQPIPVRVGTGN